MVGQPLHDLSGGGCTVNQGEDATMSASMSRSASWVTGESSVEPQSTIEMLEMAV